MAEYRQFKWPEFAAVSFVMTYVAAVSLVAAYAVFAEGVNAELGGDKESLEVAGRYCIVGIPLASLVLGITAGYLFANRKRKDRFGDLPE